MLRLLRLRCFPLLARREFPKSRPVGRRFSNRRAEVKLYPFYLLAKKARVRPQSALSVHPTAGDKAHPLVFAAWLHALRRNSRGVFPVAALNERAN